MRIRSAAGVAGAPIDECAEVVDAGGIIVLPTRRWYMLCCDSTDATACRRIFDGKGRPLTKPLAVVMPSNDAVAARFVLSVGAGRLVGRLWPGDLALLLPWRQAGEGEQYWWLGATSAMVTRDPWMLGQLAARTRNPPAVTVVSRSDAKDAVGRQPALTPAAVIGFAERSGISVDIVVDGGRCPLGVGLTVVDCSSEPRVVREGAIPSRVVDAALHRL